MIASFLVFGLLASAPSPPPQVAQFRLAGDLLSATGGPALEIVPAGRALGFMTQEIGGQPAAVAYVGAGTSLRLRHGLGANGDGQMLNRYTVLIDVKLDRRGRRSWAGLLQLHPDNLNDAEWAVRRSRGLGGRGVYGGAVDYGRWYRLGLVVDSEAGEVRHYVDGARVATRRRATIDGRYGMEDVALLFADDNGQTAPAWLGAVQVRDVPLTDGQMAALGPASAAGLPVPVSPSFSWSDEPAPRTVRAGDHIAFRWEATSPQGLVTIALQTVAGRMELGRAPAAAGLLRWRADRSWAGEARVVLRWQGAADVDALVWPGWRFDGHSPAGPIGRQLMDNGDFSRGLHGWEAAVGTPDADAGAVVGTGRGDYRVVQEIDLVSRGFHAAWLDAGLAIEASARFKTDAKTGKFCDHAALRVSFVDGDGVALAAVRTPPAAGKDWHTMTVSQRLPMGTRLLRVAVVGDARRGRRADGSVDDVRLVLLGAAPQRPLRLTKLPTVFGTAIESVTILWETDHNLGAVALQARRGDGPWDPALVGPVESWVLDDGSAVHRAEIRPLWPASAYSYRLVLDGEAGREWTFQSAPPASSGHRIAWVADNQNGLATFRQVVGALGDAQPNMAFFPGDIVQHGQVRREWQGQWFGPLSEGEFGQTTPFLFARGNHDGEHTLAYVYSALPGNGAWFAFTYGPVRYIVLDTEASANIAPLQTRWLKRELASPASRKAAFRVVTLHKPPFSNLWDRPVYDGQKWVRTHWVPIFEEAGVDLVVAGHAHGYMRYQHEGITYLVVGGGGGRLDTADSGNWDMEHVASVHHFAIMDATSDVLTWRVQGLDGALIDGFEILPSNAKTPHR